MTLVTWYGIDERRKIGRYEKELLHLDFFDVVFAKVLLERG